MFIPNRLAKIQTITDPSLWKHIKTLDNPADIISRGQLPNQLLKSTLWWNGPVWLSKDEISWPTVKNDIKIISDDILELKVNNIIANRTAIESYDIFNKYSSVIRLQRIVTYCFRFVNNTRCNSENRQGGSLSTQELHIN